MLITRFFFVCFLLTCAKILTLRVFQLDVRFLTWRKRCKARTKRGAKRQKENAHSNDAPAGGARRGVDPAELRAVDSTDVSRARVNAVASCHFARVRRVSAAFDELEESKIVGLRLIALGGIVKYD